jgi:hypothetical protein
MAEPAGSAFSAITALLEYPIYGQEAIASGIQDIA